MAKERGRSEWLKNVDAPNSGFTILVSGRGNRSIPTPTCQAVHSCTKFVELPEALFPSLSPLVQDVLEILELSLQIVESHFVNFISVGERLDLDGRQ